MSVCLCNGLTEARIGEAIGRGARSVADIFRLLDRAPTCGKCTPLIRNILSQRLPDDGHEGPHGRK